MAQHEEDLIQFDEPPRFQDIKLPSFWSDKPASWFALAEAHFCSHNIGGEQAKFDHVVGALSKESIGRVLDLVEVPPLFNTYTALKARLLDAHQLTDYQRVDQLLKMGDLGARRPSELLAAMLELCPLRTGDQPLLHASLPVLATGRAPHHAGQRRPPGR